MPLLRERVRPFLKDPVRLYPEARDQFVQRITEHEDRIVLLCISRRRQLVYVLQRSLEVTPPNRTRLKPLRLRDQSSPSPS